MHRKWLDLQPSQGCFVGFEGPISWSSPIIRVAEGKEPESDRPSKGQIIEKADGREPSKPSKPAADKIPSMLRGESYEVCVGF